MPLIQSGIGYRRKFTFVDVPGHPVIQRRNAMLGTHDPLSGKPYEVCPMCSAMASLRTDIRNGDGTLEDTVWECKSCGYRDSDKLGPLN